MLGLESGELQPENADEEHFLKVLANPELAENKLEKAWLNTPVWLVAASVSIP
ncbi:hypothetical protein VCH_002627 [Vibrio cholerae CIRS101]|nr:hypothetical protein VCH_002627 [Vibrio cholerae CIRS101]